MSVEELWPMAVLLSSTACASLGVRKLLVAPRTSHRSGVEACIAVTVLCAGIAFGGSRYGVVFASCAVLLGYLTVALLPKPLSGGASWLSAVLMLFYIQMFIDE